MNPPARALPGGYAPHEMLDVLRQACVAVGLDSTDAVLLRGQTNAVIRLAHHPVVVKIARRGTDGQRVRRTVDLVRWLMGQGFPTVPLHPVEQPLSFDGHAVTFWTYLPQPGAGGVPAVAMAPALRTLHRLPKPPAPLRDLDNVAAIRASIAATEALTGETLDWLAARLEQLALSLGRVEYALPASICHGDPQHNNALFAEKHAVLSDWDTAAWGQPEWDLVTVEIHCRRFGYEPDHYRAFADAYGFDVREWPGYRTLREIRELRMITTNARKVPQAPATLPEIERRIAGLRAGHLGARWQIL
ncbi:aminoglycoside phosphotransferase family protein [Streptomyces sp. RFCAC02]|uniref:phosphotransferase family protein n=1 Tax=Streptomyces sp. RFCAC02 TaxID=2499143 RepID=UPI00101FC4C5|nr:aminoglycoside phosphotransferase family protein [Streptomyces sp. RFCAC02]